MYSENCQYFKDLPDSVNEIFHGTNMRYYKIMMGKKSIGVDFHVTEYDIYRYGFKSHITAHL